MPNLLSLAIPHGPIWAIEEAAAMQLQSVLSGIDAQSHREEFEARGGGGLDARDLGVDVQDGVAIVSIVGPMTKSPTSFDPGASTVLARRQIRAAASDDSVKAILLRIDSPGGSVSGTDDLAQDVAAARGKKPCYAYIEDMGCSAAYWVASQCNKVFASKTALVGSIGTYMALTDYSRMAENAGIRVHVISTGKLKGAGVPGAPITDEQLAGFRQTVDDLNSHFLAAVAKGRRMARAKVEALADGGVHVGEKAVALGLVDEIASFDQVFNSLRGSKASGAKAETTISGEGLPPAGMTLADESEQALAAVRGLTARIADLRDVRQSEGRGLSSQALSHVTSVLAELEELRAALEAVAQPTPDLRQALKEATVKAELLEAVHG